MTEKRLNELKDICQNYWNYRFFKVTLDTGSIVKPSQSKIYDIYNPVLDEVVKREGSLTYVRTINKAAKIAGGKYWKYILIGATKDLNYQELREEYDIPCSGCEYSKLYGHFFDILDKQFVKNTTPIMKRSYFHF